MLQNATKQSNKNKVRQNIMKRGEYMNKDYYTCKDIQEITGAGKSLAYEIIRKLLKAFEKEYPEAITIQGKIPKWYFEKKMHNKEEEGEI